MTKTDQVIDRVILVDKNNRRIGTEEKLKAHIYGKLHRAFSIFIFNEKNELLLQQRALDKYHCPGLWSNTVCSHPRPGESYSKATHRRMKEEIGFDCLLKKKFCFIYKIKFDDAQGNGLTEHEYDCVFVGKINSVAAKAKIKPNPKEVMNWKWISLKDLEIDIKKHPNKYTFWMKVALKRLLC